MKANQHGYVLLVLCRVVLLLWVFGLLVFFASRYRSRIDLTAEKLYTLTPATKKVLDSLKDRLMIECYFSPDDKFLFTTNGASNDVTVIDVSNLKATKSIKTGRYPWGVVISPN